MTETDRDFDVQARRRLPIGIQTFRRIREEGYYYVDKTAWLRRLVDEGTHYFLSRPRRFGKSLLVDTLKELFEGNEPLFEGLDVHGRWDWSVRRPVVRLDFSGGNFAAPDGLHANLTAQLAAVERRARLAAGPATAPDAAPLAMRRSVAARAAGQGDAGVSVILNGLRAGRTDRTEEIGKEREKRWIGWSEQVRHGRRCAVRVAAFASARSSPPRWASASRAGRRRRAPRTDKAAISESSSV